MNNVYIISFLLALISGNLLGQQLPTEGQFLYIGEFRTDKKEIIPWEGFLWENPERKFEVLGLEGAVDSVQVYLQKKESYYPQEETPGVEIIISSDKLIKSDFKLRGRWLLNEIDKKKAHQIDHNMEITVNGAKKINATTYKLSNAIKIHQPEILSIVVFSNYLYLQLLLKDEPKGGFSKTVQALTSYTTYPDVRENGIDNQTYINFFKLYDFLGQYVPDTSFFVQEGVRLNQRIADLKRQVAKKNTINTLSLAEQNKIRTELVDSEAAYKLFQKTQKLISNYSENLEAILFSFNCGMCEIDEPNKFKVKLNLGANVSFFQNSVNQLIRVNDITPPLLIENLDSAVIQYSPSVVLSLIGYYHTKGKIDFGVHVGGGINFQSNEFLPAFFTGGSFILGAEKKTVFSFGVSFLNINQLHNQCVFDEPCDAITSIDDALQRNLRASPFLSLAYQFSKPPNEPRDITN